MTRCASLLYLTFSLAFFGCSTSGEAGGAAGAGGMGGTRGATGGEGGRGGATGLGFASIAEVIESGLDYQRARCECPDPVSPEPLHVCVSSSTEDLRMSDRQVTCFDDLAAGDETLADRFDCLRQVDLDATACVEAVVACDETSLADCEDARELARNACPDPDIAVIEAAAPCFETTPEDAVDAYLDAFAVRCECFVECSSDDLPDPDMEACILEVVTAEAAALGEMASDELACDARNERELEICFETLPVCEGPLISCGGGGVGIACRISVAAAYRDCLML